MVACQARRYYTYSTLSVSRGLHFVVLGQSRGRRRLHPMCRRIAANQVHDRFHDRLETVKAILVHKLGVGEPGKTNLARLTDHLWRKNIISGNLQKREHCNAYNDSFADDSVSTLDTSSSRVPTSPFCALSVSWFQVMARCRMSFLVDAAVVADDGLDGIHCWGQVRCADHPHPRPLWWRRYSTAALRCTAVAKGD